MTIPQGPRLQPKPAPEPEGGGLPGGGGGTSAKDRHVDTGVRTAQPPKVSDKTVDTSTAGPNGQGTTNTRGQKAYEADRFKPHG